MAESKAKVINQLDLAIKRVTLTYNMVGNGDISYKRAGEHFDKWIGDEVLTVMKKALELLREEERQ